MVPRNAPSATVTDHVFEPSAYFWDIYFDGAHSHRAEDESIKRGLPYEVRNALRDLLLREPTIEPSKALKFVCSDYLFIIGFIISNSPSCICFF